MSFQKPHNYGIPPKENPLDTNPLTLKLPKGLRSRVRLIPNWQNELRELIAKWVESKNI